MNTNLHLVFPGNCREAFAFYKKTFGTEIVMSMTFGEAPVGTPVPPDAKDLIMHIAMHLGNSTLMGCDTPPGRQEAMGGFQISLDFTDESELKRVFAALSEGASVQMPLAATFWSPLFGMLKDRFGVGWMLSIAQPQQS
jgi:PhnB protein